MQLFKILVFAIVLATGFLNVAAQKNKQSTVRVNSLFGDLPLDEASGNSVLRSGEDPQEKIIKNIFVTGSISKSTCFLGEPVLLTYRLYTALQSKSVIIGKPSLVGFSVEEKESGSETMTRKKMGERTYRVFTLWEVKLTPFQEGKQAFDILSVQNEVKYVSAGLRPHNYSGPVSSNRLDLTVLPLPAKGRPQGFAGAIGRFSIRSMATAVSTAAGENDTLHIEIEGIGNLDNLGEPSISWPAGFEHFTAREKSVIDKNAFPIKGKKILDIPFVAHKQGNFTIPALAFSYFDPVKKTYRTVHSDSTKLAISPELSTVSSRHAAVSILPVSPGYNYFLIAGMGSMLVGITCIFLVIRQRQNIRARALAMLPVKMQARDRLNNSDPMTESNPMTEPDSESPADEQIPDVLRQLEELSVTVDPGQYVMEIKKLLITWLQERLGTDMVAEEELVSLLDGREKELATAVHPLFMECNELLYTPDSMEGMDRISFKARISYLFSSYSEKQV